MPTYTRRIKRQSLIICTVELVRKFYYCKIIEFWLAFGYLFLSTIVEERNIDTTAFPSTIQPNDTVGEDDTLRRRGIVEHRPASGTVTIKLHIKCLFILVKELNSKFLQKTNSF